MARDDTECMKQKIDKMKKKLLRRESLLKKSTRHASSKCSSEQLSDPLRSTNFTNGQPRKTVATRFQSIGSYVYSHEHCTRRNKSTNSGACVPFKTNEKKLKDSLSGIQHKTRPPSFRPTSQTSSKSKIKDDEINQSETLVADTAVTHGPNTLFTHRPLTSLAEPDSREADIADTLNASDFSSEIFVQSPQNKTVQMVTPCGSPVLTKNTRTSLTDPRLVTRKMRALGSTSFKKKNKDLSTSKDIPLVVLDLNNGNNGLELGTLTVPTNKCVHSSSTGPALPTEQNHLPAKGPIVLCKEDGDVTFIDYQKDILTVVQTQRLSFWKCTTSEDPDRWFRVGWEPQVGQGFLVGALVVSRILGGGPSWSCFQLWRTRVEVCDNIDTVFTLTIHTYHADKNRVIANILELNTIFGKTEHECFLATREVDTPTLVVSWSTDPSVEGSSTDLRAYTLTKDCVSLSSCVQLELVQGKVKTLLSVDGYKVVCGCSESSLYFWCSATGELLNTVTTNLDYAPGVQTAWDRVWDVRMEKGLLFLVLEQQGGLCVTVVSLADNKWLSLTCFPVSEHTRYKLSSARIADRYLLAGTDRGCLLWDLKTAHLLGQCEMLSEGHIVPNGPDARMGQG
ncbi:unnamed protein product [Timema podura]|uniref:Partner and localiser of BRCA2 WD40 domain-containing protein n=1 Tax=Timema podura TaxID=61482 RepID=A0ABN7NTN5_TIMPD|nr:unnamed protein product [Timema podura]